MIEITKAYKTEDGKMFSTMLEAKSHELNVILSKDGGQCENILENADKIIAILKLKPRKARTVKVKKCKTVLNVPK